MSTNFRFNRTTFSFFATRGHSDQVEMGGNGSKWENQSETSRQSGLYDSPFGRYGHFWVDQFRTIGIGKSRIPGGIYFESLHSLSVSRNLNFIIRSAEIDLMTFLSLHNSWVSQSESRKTVKYIDIHPLGPIMLTTGPQICTETVYAHFGASKMHENEEGGELEAFRT